MASKKKRIAQVAPTPPVEPAIAPQKLAVLPKEIVQGDWTVMTLALMIFLASALGVPHEEMLQDTLKSVIVSFSALAAAHGLRFGQHGLVAYLSRRGGGDSLVYFRGSLGESVGSF